MVVVAAAFGGYLIVGAGRVVVGEVDRADVAVAIGACTAVLRGMPKWVGTCKAAACTTMTVQLPQVYLGSGVTVFSDLLLCLHCQNFALKKISKHVNMDISACRGLVIGGKSRH